jgi:hypothetical protein
MPTKSKAAAGTAFYSNDINILLESHAISIHDDIPKKISGKVAEATNSYTTPLLLCFWVSLVLLIPLPLQYRTL